MRAKKALHVLTVIGTRPEAIKLASVLLEFKKYPSKIISHVCVTAQHREMLDQVLETFKHHADFDLDVMTKDQTLCQVGGEVLLRIESLLQQERYDWLLVQGDTTTVAAAALAAYYNRVKVAHIEAGLRTHDKWQPFPEEINRRVIGAISDLHFAPTEKARQNLLSEGVPSGRIVVTGNTVVDALFYISKYPPSNKTVEILNSLGINHDGTYCPRLILVTAHRRENFGRPLREICGALQILSQLYHGQIRIVYPVHLNPNVQKPVYELLADIPTIVLLPPLNYETLVHLMRRAYLILTDSGGIQEEAPSFGVPVMVLRRVTERPEGVEYGVAKLVGVECDQIVNSVRVVLDNPEEHKRMARVFNPYGDGRAAQRIVEKLLCKDGHGSGE